MVPKVVAIRRVLLNMVLLAVSCLIALGLGELITRIIYPEFVGARTDGSFWHYDALLGWKHRPGESGRMIHGAHVGKAVVVPVKINSAGFRDKERSMTPAAEKCRVAVLGDSMVFGFGVPFESVFTAAMEEVDPTLEVLNFGVSGYSTDQELLELENVVKPYQPRVVLLIVMNNDFVGNETSIAYGYPKPRYVLRDGQLVLTNVPVPKVLDTFSLYTVERFVRHHSALYQFFSYRLFPLREAFARWYKKRMRARVEKSLPHHEPKPAGNVDPDRIAIALSLIEWFAQECKSFGAIPVVVLPPDAFPLAPDMSRAKARIRDFCAEDALCKTVDLYPAFNSYEGDKMDLFIVDKIHWSELGHQIVARELAREVRSIVSKEAAALPLAAAPAPLERRSP